MVPLLSDRLGSSEQQHVLGLDSRYFVSILDSGILVLVTLTLRYITDPATPARGHSLRLDLMSGHGLP